MDSSKTPLDIMTDDDVMREFRFNKNFIARHSRQMGARGRPRRYLRSNVENFMVVYFSSKIVADMEKRSEAIRRNDLFKSLALPKGISVIGGGKILGKGGRRRTA